MSSVLQLKLVLTTQNRLNDPGIYRRIQVLDTINFYELHCILQIAMGWSGVGSHEFRDLYDNSDIICNDFDYSSGPYGMVYDSQGYPVKGFLKHNSLSYYDYIDESDNHWLHVLFVEDVFSKEAGKQYPLCLEGEKNCPPEAFTGWDGYLEMVEGKGKLHSNYLKLSGSAYDPNSFNLEQVNTSLLNWKEFKQHWLDIKNQLEGKHPSPLQ